MRLLRVQENGLLRQAIYVRFTTAARRSRACRRPKPFHRRSFNPRGVDIARTHARSGFLLRFRANFGARRPAVPTGLRPADLIISV